MSAQLMAVMLWALVQVETPHGIPPQPGPAGETGAWQLTPAVRHDRAHDLYLAGRLGPFTDRELAEAQVRWLEQRLTAAAIDPSPFNLALAWNAGLGSVLRGRAPLASYQYATRVKNLVESK